MVRWLAICVTCCFIWAIGAAEAKRIALVIGNNAYHHVAPLQKAVNDAHAIADVLESPTHRFEVIRAIDVSRRDMIQQIQRFISSLQPGDEALVYFSGHGVEIDGQNFLWPVDIPRVQPGQESVLTLEAISVDALLDNISKRGAKITILILDACRDNPFARSGTKSVGGKRGLAETVAARGHFILYSANVGQSALDRLSDYDSHPNSVFTRNLLPLLARGDQNLPMLARDVRRNVVAQAWTVNHDQNPVYFDNLLGDFYFNQSNAKAPLTRNPVSPNPSASPRPVTALPTEPSVWRLALYSGVDLFGGDLGRTDANTAQQCGTFCGDNPACRAFTFNAQYRVCFLKSAQYRHAQFYEGAESGFFFNAPQSAPAPNFSLTWRVTDQANIPGNDLYESGAPSFEQCLADCEANGSCGGITFDNRRSRKQCWLKAAGGQLSMRSAGRGLVSAIRTNDHVTPYLVLDATAQ